jgi:hypothetical protein
MLQKGVQEYNSFMLGSMKEGMEGRKEGREGGSEGGRLVHTSLEILIAGF